MLYLKKTFLILLTLLPVLLAGCGASTSSLVVPMPIEQAKEPISIIFEAGKSENVIGQIKSAVYDLSSYPEAKEEYRKGVKYYKKGIAVFSGEDTIFVTYISEIRHLDDAYTYTRIEFPMPFAVVTIDDHKTVGLFYPAETTTKRSGDAPEPLDSMEKLRSDFQKVYSALKDTLQKKKEE